MTKTITNIARRRKFLMDHPTNLYVYSIDQLRSVLDDLDLLQLICRETIGGALLMAVRAELKRIEVVDNQVMSPLAVEASEPERVLHHQLRRGYDHGEGSA